MNVAFTVSDKQAAIMSDPSKVKNLACGRRWGKTTLLAYALVSTALKYPKCKVWMIGQNYARALELKATMADCLDFMKLVKQSLSQFPPRFILNNGSIISFRSYDYPEGLLGSGLKLICIDESALAPESLYQQICLPMTADSDGQIILASNYSQGKNWFYNFAKKYLEPETWTSGIRTWELPSSDGPRFQGIKGRARLEWYKRNLPEAVYLCEFENQPLAGIDAVFRWNADNEAGIPLKAPDDKRRYVVGIDIGRVVDPSAVVVVDDEYHVVFAEQFPRGASHAIQAQRAAQIVKNWRATGVADSTGGGNPGGEPYFHLYREAIPNLREYVWTRETKFRIINNLALLIEQRKLTIPNARNYAQFDELINQIKSYKFIEGEMNVIKYGAPKGGHDDFVAALAMAAWGRSMNWLGVGGGPISAGLF